MNSSAFTPFTIHLVCRKEAKEEEREELEEAAKVVEPVITEATNIVLERQGVQVEAEKKSKGTGSSFGEDYHFWNAAGNI
jgi:hypothetical protein